MSQEFQDALKSARINSRWPEQEDFAFHTNVSLGGIKKYERGDRLPSVSMLKQISRLAKLSEEVEDNLLRLRNVAKALQAGVDLLDKVEVDVEPLAKKLVNEAAFILRKHGHKIPSRTESVMKNRFLLILKATLEK